MYLIIIKATDDKSTPNIIHNGERLKAFLLKSVIDKGAYSHHCYSTLVLEVLAKANSQKERQREVIQIRKKEIKSFLFADGMIFLIENPKDFTKIFLIELTFSNVSRDKINI